MYEERRSQSGLYSWNAVRLDAETCGPPGLWRLVSPGFLPNTYPPPDEGDQTRNS